MEIQSKMINFSQELKLKDEECERLSKVRDQLGQELEELTASLFEVGLFASCSKAMSWFSYIDRIVFRGSLEKDMLSFVCIYNFSKKTYRICNLKCCEKEKCYGLPVSDCLKMHRKKGKFWFYQLFGGCFRVIYDSTTKIGDHCCMSDVRWFE